MPISKMLSDALERARNLFVTGSPVGEDDSPDFKAPFYLGQIADVELVRHVYGGTKVLRQQGLKYLPRHAAEQDVDYSNRRFKATSFNATAQTAHGLTGMVARKDPILGPDVPAPIVEHAENIDLQGRHLAVFAKDLLLAGVLDGHTSVHVEYPQTGDILTRLQEREAGVRPYWTHVLKENLINARWTYIRGQSVLTLAVYREEASEDVGLYGSEALERYRVLLPGAFQVYERLGSSLVKIDEGEVSLPYIPLFTFYTNRQGMLESSPPLLDLAYENIGHWQLRSDYRHALELTCFPLLFAAGFDADSFKIGPSHALRSENVNAKAEWIEPAGSSLSAVRQELQDIEGRMAALGLQMLVRDTRAAETAESKRISASERDASLAAAAKALQDTLEAALQAHADFMGLPSGGSVTVNTDFRAQEMEPRMIEALSNLVERGQMSLETMWERLQEGDVLPTDFDSEMELSKIDAHVVEDLLRSVNVTKQNPQNN